MANVVQAVQGSCLTAAFQARNKGGLASKVNGWLLVTLYIVQDIKTSKVW
jgi:hypothetical protein